ncbi:MAG TPA: AlpA family phage regulatory protein [Candidatus Tumulicola sp.]|nr:AlpA family phage regulatory protein [Candidatus Tumulicola sp.]
MIQRDKPKAVSALVPGGLVGAADYLSIARSTLCALRVNDPSFPKPVQITARRIGFYARDLDSWLEARRAA